MSIDLYVQAGRYFLLVRVVQILQANWILCVCVDSAIPAYTT